MANYRQVNTFFWDDPYIEDLCPNGKLLFLYFVTCPLTNLAGSFEISLKQIAFHTGLERETISELLQLFERDGKCIYRDKWMFMCNTIEHQHWETHATIRKGIANIVATSPHWVKDRVCIAYEWLSYLKETNSTEKNNGVPPVAAVAAADSSSRNADKAQQSDPVETRIWTDGAEMLKRSGIKDPRPLLGRLAKENGKALLAECIAATQAENPADPKAFLVKTLKHRSQPNPAAMVGKSDYVEETVNCRTCFDTGEKQIFPNPDSIEGAFNIPCPDCGGERA